MLGDGHPTLTGDGHPTQTSGGYSSVTVAALAVQREEAVDTHSKPILVPYRFAVSTSPFHVVVPVQRADHCFHDTGGMGDNLALTFHS